MGSRLERLSDWDALARKADFKAKALAALCQVSLRQLERFWRHAFAQSPQAWLNGQRVGQAGPLLRQGLPVKEVAFQLGFKQTSHFCREFKRLTGCTPNVFGHPGHRHAPRNRA